MAILIIFISWMVLMTAMNLLHDRKADKDIEELRLALDELEKINSDPFSDDEPPNVRIIVLQRRLKHLVFCCRCPWYQIR